jgi:hypothetical protein
VHALTVAVGDSQLLPYLNTYVQVTDEDISPERAFEALLELVLRGMGQPEAMGET